MMIYSEGFDAVVEALYSEAELTPYISQADVIVNPTTDKFYGKTIIISMPIKGDLLSKLSKSNKIVSRILLNLPQESYSYIPYKNKILRITPIEKSNVTADKEYFKQIKYMLIDKHIFAEVPNLILDKEYNGDLTFLGLFNKYLNNEIS